jgi:hypothetical protein
MEEMGEAQEPLIKKMILLSTFSYRMSKEVKMQVPKDGKRNEG